ncbi:hypothetical protein M5K25_016444 [Dendrobium thyrsiflorum]|uniref:Uncharacterized protein n=1 Tax=Dendrobium thyrsiflorum TaxID=117978 RepID=A0ABD0UJM4_DENTH
MFLDSSVSPCSAVSVAFMAGWSVVPYCFEVFWPSPFPSPIGYCGRKTCGFPLGKACELVPSLSPSSRKACELLLLRLGFLPLSSLRKRPPHMQELDFSNSLPTSNAMADPGIDHGFIYNTKGQVDILQSPFFDFSPDVDHSMEEYVDRIIFQLAATIDVQLSSVQWLVGSNAKKSTNAKNLPMPSSSSGDEEFSSGGELM